MAASGGNFDADLIQQFCALTDSTPAMATYFLDACGGNLELAVGMQLDCGAVPSELTRAVKCNEESEARRKRRGRDALSQGIGGASSADVNEHSSEDSKSGSGSRSTGTRADDEADDDVRAPIPQRQQVLVDDNYIAGAPAGVRVARRRAHRSVFDGFRDFQAESASLTRSRGPMSSEDGTNSGTGAHCSSKKLKTLEDLFRPPIDILHKGSFQSARDSGIAANKWLMVNIQNTLEFSCQSLNRDVWSNSTVKDVVREHFVFWQVYSDSDEGRRYMQFYKITEWPYIAVLDPRTVTAFLSEHLSPDNSSPAKKRECGSADVSPTRKKSRIDSDSILDATEESQLDAALKASLENNGHSKSRSDYSKQDNLARRGLHVSDSSSEETDDDELETFSASDDDNDDTRFFPVRNHYVNSTKNRPASQSANSSATAPSASSIVGNADKLVTDNHCKERKQKNKAETSSTNAFNRRVMSNHSSSDIENSSLDIKSAAANVASSISGMYQHASASGMYGMMPVQHQSDVSCIAPLKIDVPCSTNRLSDDVSNGIITNSSTSRLVSEGVDQTAPEDHSSILLRFPDGNRKQLKLPKSSQLRAVVKYATQQGFPSSHYELITAFPRRKFAEHDLHASLVEMGLYPQATIFVHELNT